MSDSAKVMSPNGCAETRACHQQPRQGVLALVGRLGDPVQDSQCELVGF